MLTRRKFLGALGALCVLPGGLWALGRKKSAPWTIKRLAGPYDNTQQFGVPCEPDPGWRIVERELQFWDGLDWRRVYFVPSDSPCLKGELVEGKNSHRSQETSI